MRSFVSCLAAAMLGSGLTFWIVDSGVISGGSPLMAQPAPSGPRLPGTLPAPGTAPSADNGSNPDIPDKLLPQFRKDGLTPDEAVNVGVYELANRSVVNISTLSVRPDGWLLTPVPSEGNGSGSVLDKSGHILTNYHVVADARNVVVTLYDEESYPAKLVGADPINDIAVIKIDAPAESLVPITLGESDHLRVGQRVFALGNPFGLDRTMSMGIISSLNRSLEIQENWIIKSIIQIDASINPGNSGGPLLDSHGHLIGMNTAIASRVAQSAGIGFAIPINLVRRVVPELIQHGRVIRGDIGITHVTVTEEGLRVARLKEGGPAERAGVRGPKVTRQRRGPFVVEKIDRGKADIIIAIDGQKVTVASEFLSVIESKKPGDVVTLRVLREGREVDIPVRLGGEEEVAPKRRSPDIPI